MSRDPYDVLGVPHDASDDDIREAYHRLLRVHHPDLRPEDPVKAAARTREINEAHDLLLDPVRRWKYDRSLRAPSEVSDPLSSGRPEEDSPVSVYQPPSGAPGAASAQPEEARRPAGGSPHPSGPTMPNRPLTGRELRKRHGPMAPVQKVVLGVMVVVLVVIVSALLFVPQTMGFGFQAGPGKGGGCGLTVPIPEGDSVEFSWSSVPTSTPRLAPFVLQVLPSGASDPTYSSSQLNGSDAFTSQGGSYLIQVQNCDLTAEDVSVSGSYTGSLV